MRPTHERTLEDLVDGPVPIPEMIPSYIKIVIDGVYLRIPEYKELLDNLEIAIAKTRDSKLKGYWSEYMHLAYAGAAEIWETYTSQYRELTKLRDEHLKSIEKVTKEYRSKIKLWNSVTSWNEQGVVYRFLLGVLTYLAAHPLLNDLAITISICVPAIFEGVVRAIRKRWRNKIEGWFAKEIRKYSSEYDSKYVIISEKYKDLRREKYTRYVKLAAELYKKMIDGNYRVNSNLLKEVATANIPPFTYEGKLALANVSDHYLNSWRQIESSPVV